MELAKNYQLPLLNTVASLTEQDPALPISVAADTLLAITRMSHAPVQPTRRCHSQIASGSLSEGLCHGRS